MCAVFALACAAALVLGGTARALAAGPCVGNVMYVAAHEDDTMLFQSPRLLEDVRANKCVQTVFTTAGDAGKLGNAGKYWKGREAGAEAAYAQMAAVANTWTHSEPTVNGHKVHLATLTGAPGITIVYLRLPDGGPDGKGFPPTPEPGGPSLTKLWRGTNGGTPAITEIEAVDGTAKYTYEGLVKTIGALIESFAPLEIETQNYTIPALVELDHADHIVTGKFTQVAQAAYKGAHVLRAYQGYENFVAGKSEPAANVFEPLLSPKREAFLAYVPHDEACASHEEECEGPPYTEWLEREYVAGKESVPGAVAGSSQTVLPGAAGQLDGSGSFDPGDSTPSLTYAWTQTSGPAVTLSSPTAAKPTFTAPASPATLAFSLKVKNGAENGSHESLPASVTVKAENPPPPPLPNNGGGGGNPPSPPPPKENIVVKLSKAKVKLVVGKKSKHLVKVIAPGKSAVKCRGRLPQGARCRVNAQSNVVVESSKSVKSGGTYHLVIDFAWQSGSDQRPLTVVIKRPGR